MVSRLPVVICGTTQARAGKSASALCPSEWPTHLEYSDKARWLSDLRESLLLRLLTWRWIGDMVTGQRIMSTMHWPQLECHTATGNCPTPWRSGQCYETDLTKPYSVAQRLAAWGRCGRLALKPSLLDPPLVSVMSLVSKKKKQEWVID